MADRRPAPRGSTPSTPSRRLTSTTAPSVRSGACAASLRRQSRLQSMVIAQFTGVTYSAKWRAGNLCHWNVDINPNYANYISTGLDNTRMRTAAGASHPRWANNAVIQEVSVFAIGQGVHHWVENGGELTVLIPIATSAAALPSPRLQGINADLADQNNAAFPQDRTGHSPTSSRYRPARPINNIPNLPWHAAGRNRQHCPVPGPNRRSGR